MKKMLLIFASVAIIGVAKADDQPIDYNNLPNSIKTFVSKHFKKISVSNATIDKEIMSTDYAVYLSDGTKIEFDGKGVWKEVSCMNGQVPASIVPQQIAKYVTTTYANDKILKIDKDSNGYDVKLSNGIELKFNTAMAFVGIDN